MKIIKINNKLKILLGITILGGMIGVGGYYFKDTLLSYYNQTKDTNLIEKDNSNLYNELNSLKQELKTIKLSSSTTTPTKEITYKQIAELNNQLNQKIAELNRKIIILVKVNKIFYSKLNQLSKNKPYQDFSKQKELQKDIVTLFKKIKQLIVDQNNLIDNINAIKAQIMKNKENLLDLKKQNSNLKINFDKEIENLKKEIEKLKKKKEIVDLGFRYVGFTISNGKKIGYISTNAGKVYKVKTGATINSIYKVISITNTTLIIENKRSHKVYSLTLKN